jgi:hypothetical protein
MKTMTIGLLSIGLFAFAFPVADAAIFTCDPTYTACAGAFEGGYSSGCFSFGYDEVFVSTIAGYAYVFGFSEDDCGYFTYNDIGAGTGTPVGFAGADWYSYSYGSYSACNTGVYAYTLAGGTYQPLGCPAGGPPNPGWGSLLP